MSKARISDAFFVIVSLISALILECGPPMWAEQAVAAGDAARTAASRPAQRPSVPADLLADRLQYALQDGYVHNWLVAGPLALPADGAASLAEAKAVLSSSPAENASFTIASEKLTWRYGRAMDDHLVDLSAYYGKGRQVYTWAYAQLWSPARQEIRLILSADGPAHLWLNGEQVHHQASQGKADSWGTTAPATLAPGLSEILVRFSQTGSGKTPYAMALQVTGFEGGRNGPEVLLPTTAQDVDRRRALEQLLDQAAVERAVHHRGNEILLHWRADLEGQGSYTYQVEDGHNRIYLDGFAVAEPSQSLNVGHPARIWEGDYDVVLGPRPQEYYEQGLRYQRRIPIHIVDNAYSEQPYGTYEGRWQQALEDAARRYGAGLYAEIAKLALGRDVDGERIRQATLSIDARAQGSDADMVGLLGALYRYGQDAALPPALLAQIDAFIPQSLYWDERPAEDGSAATADGHNILSATAQILAGQRYPEQQFAGTGATGAWHREQGEDAALAWLHQRATVGFGVWDASGAFQAYAVALSHLCDLAEGAQIREMTTAVLDKMLFTMALNSYKGVFGSTHGSTSSAPPQEWAAGADFRHEPPAVGHGALQPAHPGHGKRGDLCVQTAAGHRRLEHRSPGRAVEPGTTHWRRDEALALVERGALRGQHRDL